ncbi:MAG: hypothetical protein LQ350_001236 [Teloschistes chrysophthalmus]|nr:MAG: hypothetical protein LQ350_001236 [Niorma chrysophthalma]
MILRLILFFWENSLKEVPGHELLRNNFGERVAALPDAGPFRKMRAGHPQNSYTERKVNVLSDGFEGRRRIKFRRISIQVRGFVFRSRVVLPCGSIALFGKVARSTTALFGLMFARPPSTPRYPKSIVMTNKQECRAVGRGKRIRFYAMDTVR